MSLAGTKASAFIFLQSRANSSLDMYLLRSPRGDDLAIVCLTQMKEAALYNEAITEDGASSTDAGTFEVAAVCRQAKLQLPIDDGIADGRDSKCTSCEEGEHTQAEQSCRTQEHVLCRVGRRVMGLSKRFRPRTKPSQLPGTSGSGS